MLIFQTNVDRIQYTKVIEYLKKSSTATDIIKFHMNSPTPVHVMQSIPGAWALGNAYKEEKKRSGTGLKHNISWNPHIGLEGPNGILSPALSHVHELVHAKLHIIRHPIILKAKNERNQLLEEKYIVETYERKIAAELGEPVRNNYKAYYGVEVSRPFPPFSILKRYPRKKRA